MYFIGFLFLSEYRHPESYYKSPSKLFFCSSAHQQNTIFCGLCIASKQTCTWKVAVKVGKKQWPNKKAVVFTSCCRLQKLAVLIQPWVSSFVSQNFWPEACLHSSSRQILCFSPALSPVLTSLPVQSPLFNIPEHTHSHLHIHNIYMVTVFSQ